MLSLHIIIIVNSLSKFCNDAVNFVMTHAPRGNQLRLASQRVSNITLLFQIVKEPLGNTQGRR